MDFTWITNDVGDITNIAVTSPITGGGSSGSVTIGVDAASTAAAGVVQLSDSTSTTSSLLASTPTATKSAYDLAAAAVPKSTVTTAGDVIYATGSAAVTRLGIGTAGQVLKVNSGATAPEWGTATGGLTLINTTSFSAVASQSINSVFSSTYTNYKVLFNLTSASASTGNILIRLRASGSDATGSNYFRSGYVNFNGTLTSTYTTTTGWPIGNPLIAGSGASDIILFRPNEAATTQITQAASQFADTTQQYCGNHTLTTAYDGLTIFTDGGQTITGTVSIYGFAK
jgi:hypothetical protein